MTEAKRIRDYHRRLRKLLFRQETVIDRSTHTWVNVLDCLICNRHISTNALGRAAHRKSCKIGTARLTRVAELKPGQKFQFLGDERGPCIVRTLLVPPSPATIVTLKYDNDKVVNPPGVTYDHKDTEVVAWS